MSKQMVHIVTALGLKGLSEYYSSKKEVMEDCG
jgi:hypothetical protein